MARAGLQRVQFPLVGCPQRTVSSEPLDTVPIPIHIPLMLSNLHPMAASARKVLAVWAIRACGEKGSSVAG